jgi:hypothetical protein
MQMTRSILATCLVVTLALAGCGPAGDAPLGASGAAVATLAPITVGADLTAIDVCKAIPQAAIEAAMGRKLVGDPQPFEYYDATGSSGCAYDAGRGADGEAFFGYVALTPPEVYDQQPLYRNAEVAGIGQSAYFNNGADARQLWVKVNDRAALVVAFGDAPNEAGAQTIAQAVVNAIR